MHFLTPNVESGKTISWYYPFPLSRQTYGFAIMAIIGIGGLAAGLVGTLGYFHVGARGMAQLEAIIMLETGFIGGSMLLTIAIAGLKKNLQSPERSPSSEVIPSIEQKEKGSWPIFGKEEWDRLGVTIIGNIPQTPLPDLNNKILLLIPEEVVYEGARVKLTAEKMIEIAISKGYTFSGIPESFESEVKSSSPTHWVLMDKAMASDTTGKVSILELLIANLMADHYNQELLWEGKPLIGSHALGLQFQKDNKTFILQPSENFTSNTPHTVRARHFPKKT